MQFLEEEYQEKDSRTLSTPLAIRFNENNVSVHKPSTGFLQDNGGGCLK